MATVTITFTDTDDGKVKIEVDRSNLDDGNPSFADIYGYVFEQFEKKISKRANLLNMFYTIGLYDGRYLEKGYGDDDDDDCIDEDDLVINQQEEDFYNGTR